MITILIPTRKRVNTLKISLKSLIENAKEKPFLIFGVDEDDTDTLNFLESFKYENKLSIKFKPIGYENLYRYINSMCIYVKTEWLMFWNDDAIMKTKNYDEIIESEKKFKLLRVKEQTNHPYSIFPILKWDWFRLLDRLSNQTQNDAWLSEIAYMLNIMKTINVEVTHDRADITGNNNDETFQKRIYKEGNPEDPNDLHHIRHINTRIADAAKIAWYLKKIGEESLHWNKICKKEIKLHDLLHKAFKIYNQQGALGAGRQDARTDSKTETKRSDHTLSEN